MVFFNNVYKLFKKYKNIYYIFVFNYENPIINIKKNLIFIIIEKFYL